MATPSPAFVTFGEYLLAEDRDDVKHEWLNGMVFAMTRSTPTHGYITNKIMTLLTNGVGADCRVFDSNVCILVEQTHYATYADGSIVCGPLETTAVMKNGRALGEAITGQDEHVIERFVRKPDGSWEGAEARPGEHVAIHGVSIAVDDVYRGVPLQK